MTRFIPFLFVVLWSSGFIGARLGLPYAEPATFLLIRMLANIAVFLLLVAILKSRIPTGKAMIHCMVAGLLIHGFYLGGTYIAIGLGYAGRALFFIGRATAYCYCCRDVWLCRRTDAGVAMARAC